MASAGAGKPAQDFVVLPPKQTTELDLVKSLGKYISQRYSSAARKDFDDALRDLQQQRLDVSQSMEYSEGVLSGMWRYHGQLAFVEQRFPISPQSLNVVFRWTSAFEPSVSHAGASINLERVSVLWNIAYLYSRAGAEADRSTSDGAKHACNLFQVGARRRHRMLGPRRSRMPPAAPGRERRHRPRPLLPTPPHAAGGRGAGARQGCLLRHSRPPLGVGQLRRRPGRGAGGHAGAGAVLLLCVPSRAAVRP